MAEERVQRKLTTILASDVEGYSRLMSADEEATLKTLETYREIIDSLIAKQNGRLVGTAGDAESGKIKALEAVGRITGDDEAARLVIQMCLVISRSDGEFSDDEVDAVRDLCAALWLDPGDVGL